MSSLKIVYFAVTAITISLAIISPVSMTKNKFPIHETTYRQDIIIPVRFVIVRKNKLINFRKNFISKYFFFRLINEMNYIIHNLDTLGQDSLCLHNDWIESANTLKAPSSIPILFQIKDIIVIEDSLLGDVSHFNNCGSALYATYKQEIINKIPEYDSSALDVFITGSSCWEHKIMTGTVPSYCTGKYNNGTSYRMCAMGPPSVPMPIHIMVGALRLHYQHNKPSFRRMAGSLLHEIFHWAGLGHTRCPNGIMNPSGKAQRRFLNVKEQEKILRTVKKNPAWKNIVILPVR